MSLNALGNAHKEITRMNGELDSLRTQLREAQALLEVYKSALDLITDFSSYEDDWDVDDCWHIAMKRAQNALLTSPTDAGKRWAAMEKVVEAARAITWNRTSVQGGKGR